MWKVVIIDDDPQVLQGMKKSIPWEQLGAEWVGESMDGEQGLELIRKTQPHIVLTDIYMPVMNGIEMIELLRSEGYEGKIVILSGYSDFQHARRALRLNVDDYLSKPVTLQTIREVLSKVISRLEEERLKQAEKRRLEDKLVMYEPFVMKEWIKSVLTGTTTPELANLKEAEALRAKWEKQSHIVLGLHIFRSDNKPLTAAAVDSEADGVPLTQILNTALFEDQLDCEFVELHSHHKAVIVHFNGSVPTEEALMEVRKAGLRMIRNASGFSEHSIRIGVGSLKRDWQEIADSAEEAFFTIAADYSLQSNDVLMVEYTAIASSSITATGARKSVGHIKFCQQIFEGLRHSQLEQVRIAINAYRAKLGEVGFAPSDIMMLGTEIWAILTYSLYDVGIFLDEMFPELDLKQQLILVTTSDLLMDWLLQKSELICSSQQWDENLKHKQAVDFIIQYIHEHYAENITIHSLSNELYISRYYLGQIFKKATGDSFNHYLTKVRIAKARAMILEGKLLIYEVAEKVGFKNVPYFSTLFKKHTGLNPTDLLK
ncbi:response regulator transcription factor [Cohnella terricola]|uniref:Response regulator transcription factor n=1 Tax=Cohnella terricola TaxID=1289167 RepID=A0A559JTV4_9BACL|nr:response regulator transcription factor [Cohnella terricola]TVY03318.1 response regulator transcription factor [Cohnella terricola]